MKDFYRLAPGMSRCREAAKRGAVAGFRSAGYTGEVFHFAAEGGEQESVSGCEVSVMSGAGESLPYWGQWLGLATTLVGTAVGIAGLVWAWIAAKRAAGAREQAELARKAATRLGRIAQLGDLIADMHELQTMLARKDFAAIAGKANLLRGRIVRFKAEAYIELGDEEKEDLDLARKQLETTAEVAALGKASETHRMGKIQLGYGQANEALNRVVAIHGQKVRGD